VDLDAVVSDKTPRLAPSFNGRIHRLRLHERSLRTSEAIGNYRAGVDRD
jgi:hypothetical protein